MSTDEKITDNEEPKCYSHFIFIVLIIIVCLCIILPLGITSNTYKHKSPYSASDPNSDSIMYYPTSQPSSHPTYLHLRHNF